MLYIIAEHPHEINDLAEERPEICKEAVYLLNQRHDNMMKTMPVPYDNDPLWTVIQEGGPYHARGRLSGYVKYLQETGRDDAVPELKKDTPMNLKIK